MSSSRPRKPGAEVDMRLECHACGSMSMVRKDGDVTLADGTHARSITHWHCSKCGEILFDIAAMRAIRSQRRTHRVAA
jgi:YgiT-type zinc finger domain-containing protein